MKQFDKVKLFSCAKEMKLNVTKFEIVVFANRPGGAENLPVCDVDDVVVPSGNVRKCLGYTGGKISFPPSQLRKTINKT